MKEDNIIGKVKPVDPNSKPNDKNMVFGADYTVTSTTDSGGKVLTNVEVILCFWGSFWNTTPAPSPSSDDYKKAIQGILSGPYLGRLSQYRSLGSASLIYTDMNHSTDPVNGYSDADVVTMLKSRLQNTSMPPPSASHNRFYAVIFPPGIKNALTSDAGQHQSFVFNSHRGYYAWMWNTGSLTGHNCVTKVFSHELVEAMTDPDVDNGLGYGILVNGTKPGGGTVSNDEIGDTCNNEYATVDMNGINCSVQSYWSKGDNACVLPVNPPKNGSLNIVAIRKLYSDDLGVDFISEVKAIDAAGDNYIMYRAEVIQYIQTNGNTFYVHGADGTKAKVIVDTHYIKTVADNSLEDNLLSLPNF
jgi:hypothetical protein